MEIWRGSKFVKILLQETRIEPILSNPDLIMYVLHMFLLFFSLTQNSGFLREALHACQCTCKHNTFSDSQKRGFKCDTRTSYYKVQGLGIAFWKKSDLIICLCTLWKQSLYVRVKEQHLNVGTHLWIKTTSLFSVSIVALFSSW